MSENITTTWKVEKQIEKFVDATPNEVYGRGRLVTREVDEAVTRDTDEAVQLIAYGHRIIGEVDKGADSLTIFEGHEGATPTTTGYVNRLKEVAEEHSVAVNTIGMNPSIEGDFFREASLAGQYVKHYINDFENMSDVEKDAQETVENACLTLGRWLLEK